MNKLFLVVLLFVATLCVAQKCVTIVVGGVGDQCDYPGNEPINSNFTYGCIAEAACSNATSKCVKSVAYESACTGEGVVPCPHTAGLECIHGKCTQPRKIFDEPCNHADECISGICSGKCSAQAEGLNCTAGKHEECHPGFFCHATHKNCTQYVEIGGECSSEALCDSLVSDCVNGTCHALSKKGESCASGTHPRCADPLFCTKDTKTCESLGSLTVGRECTYGMECAVGLACNGTHCLPNDQVSCERANAYRCRGICKCSSDPSEEGTCAEATVNCQTESEAFDECKRSKCPASRGNSFAFAPNGCVERECSNQRKDYFCCMHKISSYVEFVEFNPDICKTPSPSPKPSPGQTPSSATVTMINVFTIFVVIASLLL